MRLLPLADATPNGSARFLAANDAQEDREERAAVELSDAYRESKTGETLVAFLKLLEGRKVELSRLAWEPEHDLVDALLDQLGESRFPNAFET